MLAAQNGRNIRKIPLINASHRRTVTTMRQPPLQKLCTRTMAKPAMSSRIPETKISPGSLPICLGHFRKMGSTYYHRDADRQELRAHQTSNHFRPRYGNPLNSTLEEGDLTRAARAPHEVNNIIGSP